MDGEIDTGEVGGGGRVLGARMRQHRKIHQPFGRIKAQIYSDINAGSKSTVHSGC